MRRHFFGFERFAKGNLKAGETFSIDSGLGGCFTVEYVRHTGKALIFKQHKTGSFPACVHRFADDRIASEHLYVLHHPSNEPYHPAADDPTHKAWDAVAEGVAKDIEGGAP